MKRFTKVNVEDVKNIQIGAGVLLKNFDVDNPVFSVDDVICATSGGVNPVCVPEYYDFAEDVDNAKQSKETKRIRGWNASISFNTVTASLNMIRVALGAADVSGKVLSLRQRLQYAKDYNDIWWLGNRMDGVLIAIRLIRALSDSGFSLQTSKGGKGQISVTLKGHSSFAEPNKIPMEVYIFAESDIPIVPDEPDTPTAMYLYGTPSDSGNIGLRVGDTVTYYDGAVLPKLPESDLQYAVIYKPLFLKEVYDLCFFSEYEYTINSTTGLRVLKVSKANAVSYKYTVNESTDWESGNFGVEKVPTAFAWTNFDTTHEDGTVAHPASDPIPVSGLVGYSYNGTILPELPEWNEVNYPYGIIITGVPFNTGYASLRKMHSIKMGDDYISYNVVDENNNAEDYFAIVHKIKLDAEDWGEGVEERLFGNSTMLKYIIWTKTDLVSTDGTWSMKASEPVPIYEVIE